MNFNQLTNLAKKKKVQLDGILDFDSIQNLLAKKYYVYLLEKDPDSGASGHYVALIKEQSNSYYFDSFGLPPTSEIIKVLVKPIKYSTFEIQDLDATNCGNLCIALLSEYQKTKDFEKSVLNLVK